MKNKEKYYGGVCGVFYSKITKMKFKIEYKKIDTKESASYDIICTLKELSEELERLNKDSNITDVEWYVYK